MSVLSRAEENELAFAGPTCCSRPVSPRRRSRPRARMASRRRHGGEETLYSLAGQLEAARPWGWERPPLAVR